MEKYKWQQKIQAFTSQVHEARLDFSSWIATLPKFTRKIAKIQ